MLKIIEVPAHETKCLRYLMVCFGEGCLHRGRLAYDALSSFVEVAVVFMPYDDFFVPKAALYSLLTMILLSLSQIPEEQRQLDGLTIILV